MTLPLTAFRPTRRSSQCGFRIFECLWQVLPLLGYRMSSVHCVSAAWLTLSFACKRMKALASLLVLVMALGACSKSPPSKTATQSLRGFPPIHTNLEIFIENYARSTHRGAQTQPDLKNLKPDGQSRDSWACRIKDDGDGAEYSAAIEYKGTEDGRDFYLVTYTRPSGAAAITASNEIAFADREIELWRDSQWRIGVRPRGQGGEPDGAANRSQPLHSETNQTSAAAGSGR
jgi:hypothetical protein